MAESALGFVTAQQAAPPVARGRVAAQNDALAGEGRGRGFMQEGLLYRKSPTGKRRCIGEVCKQVVVPEKYRRELLHVAHDCPFAGHLGMEKPCDRLRQKFCWFQMCETGRNYCKCCDLCQKHKG